MFAWRMHQLPHVKWHWWNARERAVFLISFKWSKSLSEGLPSSSSFFSVTLEKGNIEFLIDEPESHRKNHVGLFFFFVRMMTFTESISQVLGVWVGDISYKTSLLHVFNSEMFIFFHSYSLCVFSPHYFLFLSMAWSVAGYLFTCKLW